MALIALDIDGTVTTESRSIPAAVIQYLATLYEKGWSIAFITGRTYGQSHHAVEGLPFPFYLAVQNGAIILSMPSREILFKHYLDKDILLAMSACCEGTSTDVVVYGGCEHDDRCYYRPAALGEAITEYLVRRRAGYGETWDSLESFIDLPLVAFPSTKTFGAFEPLMPISIKFERDLGLQAPINRDPFQEGFCVLQATQAAVNKGSAVKDLRARVSGNDCVIAAGDDLNDIPLLQAADIRVAMANAPRQLLDLADLVAPPATEEGIIIGLSQAIKKVSNDG